MGRAAAGRLEGEEGFCFQVRRRPFVGAHLARFNFVLFLCRPRLTRSPSWDETEAGSQVPGDCWWAPELLALPAFPSRAVQLRPLETQRRPLSRDASQHPIQSGLWARVPFPQELMRGTVLGEPCPSLASAGLSRQPVPRSPASCVKWSLEGPRAGPEAESPPQAQGLECGTS